MGNLTIIEERKNELTTVLQKQDISQQMNSLFANDTVKKDKFIATLQTIAMDTSLERCSIDSIISSAMSIADLGLSLNKQMGLAYIVAYKSQAQAVIGYKGFCMLAKKAGYAVRVNDVYNCDELSFTSDGFDTKVTFVPNLEKREEIGDSKDSIDNNLKGILVGVKDIDSELIDIEFVPISKIKKLSMVAKTQMIYNAWAIEMYRAKAIKYVLSRMPIGDQLLNDSIALDNELAIKQYQDSEVETAQNGSLPQIPENTKENTKETVVIPQQDEVPVVDAETKSDDEILTELIMDMIALAKDKGIKAQHYLDKYGVSGLKQIPKEKIELEIKELKDGNKS